jgi:excisionase family DNA binding protein
MSTQSATSGARQSGTSVARLAYSIKETAAALGVSPISVRRLIDRGLLRPNRALRHLRISANEIKRFLA